MGRFYELFEMDAHVGAKELDLQYMRSIFFGNMETCLVVSIGNTKLQILSMEIEFETILSICQKRNHKPVSDDPLGDARNKVQEKIRKEYCNDGEWHHPRKRGCKACDQEGDAKIWEDAQLSLQEKTHSIEVRRSYCSLTKWEQQVVSEPQVATVGGGDGDGVMLVLEMVAVVAFEWGGGDDGSGGDEMKVVVA
ncbi:DNA mismatch repair protein MSH6 [Tanacetum coccineum]